MQRVLSRPDKLLHCVLERNPERLLRVRSYVLLTTVTCAHRCADCCTDRRTHDCRAHRRTYGSAYLRPHAGAVRRDGVQACRRLSRLDRRPRGRLDVLPAHGVRSVDSVREQVADADQRPRVRQSDCV